MAAMLAPSFVIDFPYPEIIGKLRRMGFERVVEVAWGANQTNLQLQKLLDDNPDARYITNPCPSVVRLIRTRYPHLVPFLTKIDSPMMATAKLVNEQYPECVPVFFGPCFAKKFEAREDCPELGIIVLTYKELAAAMETIGLADEPADKDATFDISFDQTRLYPISGGLTQSANLRCTLTQDECLVVSWYSPVVEAIKQFENNPDVRLLDALFCDGGCMSGPGLINGSLSKEERRNRVIAHWGSAVGMSECSGTGNAAPEG